MCSTDDNAEAHYLGIVVSGMECRSVQNVYYAQYTTSDGLAVVNFSLRRLGSAAFKALTGSTLLVLLFTAYDFYFWHGLVFWFGAVWYSLFTFILVVYWLKPLMLLQHVLASAVDYEDGGEYFFLLIPCIHFSSFLLLIIGIYREYGADMFVNLPEAPSLLDWVGFVADRLLSVVLFDANEIFGFRFNAIEHAQVLPMSTLIFTYKLFVEVAFIVVLVRAFRFVVLGREDT